MQNKSEPAFLKSKLLQKEILDFLAPSEVAKCLVLNKSLRSSILHAPLDMFLNIKVVVSDFSSFDLYCSYVRFIISHLSVVEPHSFFICLNTFHLKEELHSAQFLKLASTLVQQLTTHSSELNSLRVNFIKQAGTELNDIVAKMIEPLLWYMGHKAKFVKQMWIDSMATEKMIQAICRVETLQELSITHCSYVTGEFLKNLKSTQLRKLDFSGSLYIRCEEIQHCILQNLSTLTALSLDGETFSPSDLNSLLEALPGRQLTAFNLFFGQQFSDMSCHSLARKLDFPNLTRLSLRKTQLLSCEAIASLFGQMMPSLVKLNLEDSAMLGEQAMRQIGSNCPNLRKANFSWSPNVNDKALEHVLMGCRKLRSLKAAGLKSISDKCLLATLDFGQQPQEKTAFHSLYFLDLTMCDYPNDSTLEKIKKQFPLMKILNYYKEEVELW